MDWTVCAELNIFVFISILMLILILGYLQGQAFTSFRQYCLETETLPVDLHVVLSDILQDASNITDIFPYFIRHAKQIFPHIDCLDDLKKISDLRSPATW